MTEAKLSTPGGPLDFGISFSDRAGESVVSYPSTPELAPPPAEYSDRIEWVRKSYERFIEKVLEIESLRGPSLAF